MADSTAPNGYDLSDHLRLVLVIGSRVGGTFQVSRISRRLGVAVQAVNVTVWLDDKALRGRSVTRGRAYVKGGLADVKARSFDPEVWPDVEWRLDEFKAAVLAAAAAVEWPAEAGGQ